MMKVSHSSDVFASLCWCPLGASRDISDGFAVCVHSGILLSAIVGGRHGVYCVVLSLMITGCVIQASI
jgi:hypothetical protein